MKMWKLEDSIREELTDKTCDGHGRLKLDGLDIEKISEYVDILIAQRDVMPKIGPWTHSACHLLEGYINGGVSLLQSEQLLSIAKKLVDAVVEGVVSHHSYGNPRDNVNCVDRVLAPIIKYVIDKATPDSLEYSFMPDSISRPEFAKLWMESCYGGGAESIAHICEARDVGELITYILTDLITDPNAHQGIKRLISDTKLVELLPVLRSRLTNTEFQEVVREYACNKTKTAEDILSDVKKSRATQECAKGIYIDVDGTLIIQYLQGKNTQRDVLEHDIYAYALHQHENGVSVTIMSGGDPQEQEERLRKLGVDERLLHVVPKDSLRGKKLEICIDDSYPAWQGFAAERYVSASDFRKKYDTATKELIVK